MCVCVCVREREREGGGTRKREKEMGGRVYCGRKDIEKRKKRYRKEKWIEEDGR